MTRIVVKKEEESGPWWRIGMVALLLALLVSGWGLFEYGRYRAGYDRAAFNQLRQQLEKNNSELEAEVRRLRQEKMELEQTRQIESRAYGLVRKDLRDLQNELLELKEELAFYRGIVSPEESGRGLQIQRFNITKDSEERAWNFKLVLTRVLKNKGVAKGTVEVQVDGIDAQGKHSSVTPLQRLRYNFKYFQNIKGKVELPEGFVPSRATVVLKPGGRGNKTEVRKSFDWPVEPKAMRGDDDVGEKQG